MSLRRKIGWDEMERATGIKRTERPSFTTADAERLERKILGRLWGKPRQKYRPK